MPPLNVYNFSEHWPVWCDEFQIYLAKKYHQPLNDQERFSIFLKCLGAKGSALAILLYPLNGRHADRFHEVWWRMNESWNVAKDVEMDRHRASDISDQRHLLLESSADEIEKVEMIIYFLWNHHHSSC